MVEPAVTSIVQDYLRAVRFCLVRTCVAMRAQIATLTFWSSRRSLMGRMIADRLISYGLCVPLPIAVANPLSWASGVGVKMTPVQSWRLRGVRTRKSRPWYNVHTGLITPRLCDYWAIGCSRKVIAVVSVYAFPESFVRL